MPYTIVTAATVIARNASALYNFKAGAATMANLVEQANGSSPQTSSAAADALLNFVYFNSVGSAKTTDVADTLVANLGITGAASIKIATDYFVALLNGATVNTRGAAVNQGLTAFAALATTTDALLTPFKDAAAAWNTKVDAAVTYAGLATNLDTTFSAAPTPTTAQTYTLAITADNLVGGTGADTFVARTINNGNTLQDGDKLDGGAGADTLYADLVNTAVPITPVLLNFETVAIRAQNTTVDSANGNNTTGNVQIDAQRSLAVNSANVVTATTGVTRWESNNSRSDVIVEDVRIGTSQKTSDVTIAFVESDPGNVDFGLYFNQQSLRNAGTGTSALNIYLMDVAAVQASVAAGKTSGTEPLKDSNFGAYSFYANNVLVTLDTSKGGDEINKAQTYTQLKDAFTLALKTANVGGVTTDLSSGVTVTLSSEVNFTTSASTATSSAPVAANFLNQLGQVLILTAGASIAISSTSTTPGAPAGGWIAVGTAPSTGAIVQTFNTGATSTTELVTSKIVLDDVGLGSTGGDLVVGGMSTGDTSTSRGVERFEITVEDHSKLQTINSTNNALREVTIVNGTTSNNVIDAYSNTALPANAGSLTVNGNAMGQTLATGSNLVLPGADNNSPAGIHHGVGAAGFTDVRLIDGSAMGGRLAFTAAITSDSLSKYVTLVDTAASPVADVAGAGNVNFNVPGANFIYTGGSNNDTMVVSIDGAVTASRSNVMSGQSDFTFNIGGGAGNDAITVRVVDPAGVGAILGAPANWYNNQNLNNNITITGGDGNDTIRKPGAGDTTIDSGAGNDAIFTENTGFQLATVATGAASTLVNGNAVWVYNTTDQVTAVPVLAARDLFNLRSDVMDTYNLYNATLTVTYLGLPSVAVPLANALTYKATDLEINQAIKNAINTDPVLKWLLVAQDGPANSLVVTSLTDGMAAVGDIAIAIAVPATLAGADLTGAAAAYGLPAGSTAATVIAAMTTSLGVYTAKGDYAPAFAVDEAAAPVALTGANSMRISDNFTTLGTGDDLIVLGTTTGATLDTSSNETVVFGPGFSGLTGVSRDVIVNFDVGGAGVDHLDFSAWVGKAPTVNAVGGLAGNSVGIVAAPATAWTDATLTAAFKLLDTVVSTASATQVYVSVDTHNVGNVYSVVNGTAAGDAIATLQGRIDMADVAWGTLTAPNFAVQTVIAEGLTTGVVVAPPIVVPPVVPGGAIAVAVNAGNVAPGNNATLGTVTYTFAAVTTTYSYTIAGFAAGDVLNFGATGTLPSIVADADQTDGNQSYIVNAGGNAVTVILTGLTAAQDAALFNAPSFNTVFGAGSMV